MELERQPGRALAARIRRQARVALLGANVAGALVVFVLGTWVIPVPAEGLRGGNLVLNLVAFGIALLGGLVLGTYLSQRAARISQDWISADRVPTPAERDATLTFPARQTAIQAYLWLAAAALFLALNVADSTTLALEAAVEVVLGGIVTCAIGYLLTERILRPATARALEHSAPDEPAGPAMGGKLILIWAAGSAVPLLALGLVGLTVLGDVPASRRQIGLAVALLALIGALAGLATMTIYARSLSEPLRALRSALGRVERGDLDAAAEVDDAGEVGVLQAGFNRMAHGLRERERLRDLFGRHVGEDVAQQAMERGGIELGGETLEAAVLFVDVIGSTTLAATNDPADVVSRLNAFFAIVVDCVSLHGGWVNKFEGDAALCVFGAPTSHPDPAGSALASARALRFRLDDELDGLEAAIGVSAGEVVAGNVGAAERFEYTVIGDPVNEAARLTELAKHTEGKLLASDAALARAGAARERDRWRFDRTESLRGRTHPTRIATPR
ncbi:MAG: adenylate cyclase [Thermoleophilaceae bacterium]|nr:adenylate cyclase [Thermoleophilaceae bacterium]